MPSQKRKTSSVSVFKGIEAKLNKAIFQILALRGPLTAYEIHKQVKARRKLQHTRYASVNRRVRSLDELGYVKRTGVKRTKAGFEATIYELTIKAYLALLLNSVDLEELLMRLDEATASAILATITHAT